MDSRVCITLISVPEIFSDIYRMILDGRITGVRSGQPQGECTIELFGKLLHGERFRGKR